MADTIPKVNFNDGEGLDEADLNRVQGLLDAKIMQRSANIGNLGGALNMGNSTGGGAFSAGGAELGQHDARSLPATKIFTPAPLGFISSDISVSGLGVLNVGLGPWLFMQGSGASTPGTAPDGFKGLLSYLPDDDEIGLSSARPTVNNRWDAFGARLGHAAPSATESRDFEDAATRALTTTTPAKDQTTSFEVEVIQGTEAATPVIPAQSAGYATYAAVKRATGETSLDPDDFRLFTYPMNLKVETVMGSDGWFATTSFDKNSARPGSIQKNGAGAADLYMFSRNMHAGHRLVGVGICTQNTTRDIDVVIQRAEYDATGTLTLVDLLNVGAGNPLGTTNEGFNFAGLDDFVDADGNELPIWGNGRTYGPLLGDHGAAAVDGLVSDALAIKFADAAWVGAENIAYVKFYYLE